MGFLRRLSVLFYLTFVMFIGAFVILMAIDVKYFHYLVNLGYLIYGDENLKYLAGTAGGLLIVFNYMFWRLISVNPRRDKIIAFDNPNGRVTVSLFAMEDMIRRTLMQFIEIKDVKPVMMSTSKGLHIKVPLVLKSDLNIPEVTARVQSQVLKQVKNTIGEDQAVDVNVYVGKIHPKPFKQRIDKSEKGAEPAEPTDKEPIVPYQGYKA